MDIDHRHKMVYESDHYSIILLCDKSNECNLFNVDY